MNLFGEYKLFYSLLLFLLTIITTLPIYNIHVLFDYFNRANFKTESSVWCIAGVNGQVMCKFKNICYDSHLQSFIFFLGNDTKIKGLHDYTHLQKIQLSSINLHNRFFANISVVNVAHYKTKKTIKVEERGFLFSRFKPDNVMHVMHDDLLPLFLSLDYICSGDNDCMQSYRLIIHDEHSDGVYFYLYKLFSNGAPVVLRKLLPNSSDIYCWEEIRTGLNRDGIFYQYGFNEPHGPIKNALLSHNNIIQFAEFIKKGLNIAEDLQTASDVLIISRNKTRRILNAEELEQMVLKSNNNFIRISNIKSITLDLQEKNIRNIINEILHCKILIGMHGAELILSIFLQPKTLLIELFPFAIQPEIVSFVKPLSELKGNHFLYFPWKNTRKTNSLPHPDAPLLLGGIAHLDEVLRDKIIRTEVVPPVKCCNDPNYLYHMYQDTRVGHEFKVFFNDALNLFQNFRDNYRQVKLTDEWFFPSPPTNVSCQVSKKYKVVNIRWDSPFNIKDKHSLRYNIYVADSAKIFGRELITMETYLKLQLPEELGTCPQVQFWISVTLLENRSQSRDISYSCICSN